MNFKERNDRIENLLSSKMKYLFKEVLTAVEKETKDFDIKGDFFSKTQGRPRGFYQIRKKLFDHGNEIVELLKIILSQVEITAKDEIINIDQKVMKQIDDEK